LILKELVEGGDKWRTNAWRYLYGFEGEKDKGESDTWREKSMEVWHVACYSVLTCSQQSTTFISITSIIDTCPTTWRLQSLYYFPTLSVYLV